MDASRFTVILLTICVFKSESLSYDELEDFSDFLKRTSQLDQNIKNVLAPLIKVFLQGNVLVALTSAVTKPSANPEDEDEEPISDHAWEDSGKFEGDLILNEKQRRLIVEDVAEGLARNGLRDSTKRWPNNEIIFYIQREHFSEDQLEAIRNGMNDIAQASCVKFRPYRKGDRDAVVIQGSRRGCFSQVGYQGGYQVLNLSGRHPVGRGCFRHGTVVHELLHSLGFYHMQSSPDRDDYVDVIWENVLQPARHNFKKYNTFSVSDFGVGYDYDSVLHYSRRAFSKNGQDTIVPKQSGASIGQRIGLSDKDTQKLNKMYCDTDSNNFDSDESQSQPNTGKRKKPKNKPFEGHGIGYHQGNTVLIKLSPTAKTFTLSSIPPNLKFDSFSKAPKTVSSPSVLQEFGFVKKVTNLNHSVVNIPKLFTQKRYDVTTDKSKHVTYNFENEISDNLSNKKEFFKPGIIDNKISSDFDYEKIKKNHMFVSKYPDVDIHNTGADYNNYYSLEHKFKDPPENNLVEKLIDSDPSVDSDSDSYLSKIQKTKQFISSLTKKPVESLKSFHTHSDNKLIENPLIFDKLNQKSNNSGHRETKDNNSNSYKIETPESLIYPVDEIKGISVTNLSIQSSPYNIKNENNNNEKSKDVYKLFGDPVPLLSDWYKVHNIEHGIKKYPIINKDSRDTNLYYEHESLEDDKSEPKHLLQTAKKSYIDNVFTSPDRTLIFRTPELNLNFTKTPEIFSKQNASEFIAIAEPESDFNQKEEKFTEHVKQDFDYYDDYMAVKNRIEKQLDTLLKGYLTFNDNDYFNPHLFGFDIDEDSREIT